MVQEGNSTCNVSHTNVWLVNELVSLYRLQMLQKRDIEKGHDKVRNPDSITYGCTEIKHNFLVTIFALDLVNITYMKSSVLLRRNGQKDKGLAKLHHTVAYTVYHLMGGRCFVL